jgi:hypothetical protein
MTRFRCGTQRSDKRLLNRAPPSDNFFMRPKTVHGVRRLGAVLLLIAAWAAIGGCGAKSSVGLGLAQRADAALIDNEPPWDSLLAGRSPDSLVRNDQLGLAQYCRAKGLRIIVSVDATDGLDRSADSAPLVAAGRSLTEPAIRQLYERYVVAIDTLIHPDYLGVASETNLIRLAAPGALYNAVVTVADSSAALVRSYDGGVKLFTTVQVDAAWGRLGAPGNYVGIAQDRSDFAFDQVLGLSSYPYLAGFAEPESIPADYYSRLTQGPPIPEMVIEGGWTSASVTGVTSTPDKQRRYIVRQAELLDQARAIAVFQLPFTDLDLTGVTLPPGSILPLFAALGLVDVNLTPKPALTAWDATFRRPRH